MAALDTQKVFQKNEQVIYSKNGQQISAKIISIHTDDIAPYYTISINERGIIKEKQTIAANLERMPSSDLSAHHPSPTLSSPSSSLEDTVRLSTWTISRINSLNKNGLAHFSGELDDLGRQSGIAQNLTGPITSIEKLLQNSDQCLITARDQAGHLVGYLKYGFKDLFFYNKKGKVTEFPSCTCLLDFYVSHKLQRNGVGLALFREFLARMDEQWASSASASTTGIERFGPEVVAYDRPSPKLISFMRKHYGLTQPDLQPNRYTIFEGFPIK